jgi:sulfide:quinone oxidoreductase
MTAGTAHPRRVVICGGGVAAVEALLALRAHLSVGVEMHLVAPNRQFVYQPLAVAAPFDLAETHQLDLAEIADDQNAKLHVDSLVSVEPAARRVRLASDALLRYEALVVAVGARRRDWLTCALHFAGASDVTPFRALLERLESGAERRLAFVSPAGVSWTLPLYERGAALEVDEVVALSQLEGPAVPGLPCDAAGFIDVDAHSCVAGLSHVFAAGDGTTFPVKQGGIATQQADAAADPLWWPPSKIAGRYLAPYLDKRADWQDLANGAPRASLANSRRAPSEARR